LASKGFYRSKFAFVASIHFRQSQVLAQPPADEIGYIFSAKVSTSLVQAFCQARFFFWQVSFLAKSVFSKGFGKSSALAFFQFCLGFNGKVGLVKNCRACKIKSLKDWILFFRRRVLLPSALANKACT
jgi:hypothetical protein